MTDPVLGSRETMLPLICRPRTKAHFTHDAEFDFHRHPSQEAEELLGGGH